MAKVRISVTISEELKNWLDEQEDKFGMNYSSMVAMALMQYKQNLEAMKALGNIQELSRLIEEQQNKNS